MIADTVKKIARHILDKTDNSEMRRRQLIVKEAEVGGQLFGETPKGYRRDFFYLGREGNRDVWVWHESTEDGSVLTTRYEVHVNGIIKIQDGQPHRHLSEHEAIRLKEAISAYYRKIKHEVYA